MPRSAVSPAKRPPQRADHLAIGAIVRLITGPHRTRLAELVANGGTAARLRVLIGSGPDALSVVAWAKRTSFEVANAPSPLLAAPMVTRTLSWGSRRT